MMLIKKEDRHLFTDCLVLDDVPEIMHAFIIPHAKRTVYGNVRVFVFKQLLETPMFKVWQHHAIASGQVDIHPSTPRPGLHLGITLSNLSVNYSMKGEEPVGLPNGELNMFYFADYVKAVSIAPGTHCFFQIEFPETYLSMFLEKTKDKEYLHHTLMPAICTAKEAGGGIVSEVPVPLDFYSAMLIEYIRNPMGKSHFSRKMYINKNCQLLLSHFITEVQGSFVFHQHLTGEDVNALDNIKKHIRKYIHEPHVPGILARCYDIPLEKLHNGFRYLYGISFNNYVRLSRMEKAAELLSNPEADLLEVFKMVGFNQYRSFVNSFTQYYNCTPGLFKTL